jgi:hypothetical protein
MSSRSGNRSAASITLAVLVFVLAIVLMVQPASADTITFSDTTDTISVGQTGSQHGVFLINTSTGPGDCTSETDQCLVSITSPTGATPTSSAISLNIAEAGINPTVAVSDYVQAILGTNSYVVIFASDPPADPNGPLGLSPLAGAPSISETGGIQTAFTLNWSDGTSDTVKFQSDLDATVPEPSAVPVAATGCALLVFVNRLRGTLRKKGA